MIRNSYIVFVNHMSRNKREEIQFFIFLEEVKILTLFSDF